MVFCTGHSSLSHFSEIHPSFVWAHSLARLAFPQLHRPFSERPEPLLPNQEGPVPAGQAGLASAGCWRPDCPPSGLLDGDGSPGPTASPHRGRPPHWPGSTTVHGSPGPSAGGRQPPGCELGLPGGHQVFQTLQGLDVRPASTSHPAEASSPPLGPGLEEAGSSSPSSPGG
jgi:hypothetical protein